MVRTKDTALKITSGKLGKTNQTKNIDAEELVSQINSKISELQDEVRKEEYLRLQNKGPEQILAFLAVEENNEYKKLARCKVMIDMLNSGKLQDKDGQACVTALLGEFDAFPEPLLPYFVSEIFQGFDEPDLHDGVVFGLLPKLFNLISKADLVVDDNFSKPGEDYVTDAVSKMCGRYDWHENILSNLISSIKEMPLDEGTQLKVVIKKILSQLKKTELNEIPPVVYQLLMLSSKGQRARVIEGIVRLFDRLDEKCRQDDLQESQREKISIRNYSPEQLRHVQGTVMVHIDLAIKRDSNLGVETLKVFKSERARFSPFAVAFLLAIGKGQSNTKFEQQIFDILRTSIVFSFKGDTATKEIAWFKDFDQTNTLQHKSSKAIIAPSLLTAIKNSENGWDSTVKGALQLGLALMDLPLSKAGDHDKPHKSAIDLGIKALLACFKIHEGVRPEILDHIFSRVISNEHNPLMYLKLLASIVSECTHNLLDHSNKIKDTLDYFDSLSPSLASGYINAIWPLVALNNQFLDRLILVLRKAIFNREINSRITAVTGFLQLLKKLKTSKGASQVASNNELGGEILGFLRRCLTQQSEIREKLYTGLFEIFRSNVSLHDMIFELLMSQLQRYYIADEEVSVRPLKFDECVTKAADKNDPSAVQLQEPLDKLLYCFQKCVVNHFKQEDAQPSEAAETAKKMMENIITRMLSGNPEPEEFELDKSASYDLDTAIGAFNNELAGLLIGTLESTIEFLALMNKSETHTENRQLIAQSFILMQMFKQGILKSKEENKQKGKKGKPFEKKVKSVLTRPSMLGMGAIFECMKVFYATDDEMDVDANNNQDKDIRKNLEFKEFILQACLALVKEMTNATEEEETTLNQHITFCTKVSGIVFKELDIDPEQQENRDKSKDKVKSLAFECFEACVKYTSSRITEGSKMVKLFESATKYSTEELPKGDINARISAQITVLQNLINNAIRAGWNKEAEVLVECLMIIAEYYSAKKKGMISLDKLLEQHIEWINPLLIVKNEMSINLSKTLVLCFFTLAFKTDSGFTAVSIRKGPVTGIDTAQMYSFAKDILKLLKDNETLPKDDPKDEEPVKIMLKYPVITAKTEPQITSLLIQQFSVQLEQIEVLFLNLPKQKGDDDGRDVIFKRVQSLCTVFAPLLRARLSSHNHEAVGKLIMQFYKLMHMFTQKYNENEEKPSDAYSSMIEFVGKTVTPVVYNLICFITSHSDSKVTEAKIDREIRHFPNVIFWIEKFESVLIKVCGRHALEIYDKFRRSTARDFRIMDNKLKQVIEEDEDEGEKKSRKRKGGDKESKTRKKQKVNSDEV